MATLTPRGRVFAVTYTVKGENGKHKNCYESYENEIEASQRKAYIDILQKAETSKLDELRAAAEAFKTTRALQTSINNYDKTYHEFSEKWLPFYAKKKKLSPHTYDGHRRNLDVHILPVFGNRIVSTITSEDLDLFVDGLERKRCLGSKSYNKRKKDVPKLSTASISKIMSTLNASMRTAEDWRYTKKRPKTITPPVEAKSRVSWDSAGIKSVMDKIRDPMVHLLVHITFICSLRAGEAAGISLSNIDLMEGSVWIRQELERVKDEALAETPKKDIYHIFPKKVKTSTSVLVLKKLKTKGSLRKVFLPAPLVDEIRSRIMTIEKNRDYYGDAFRDSGLLFCLDNGDPQEPKQLVKRFVQWQKRNDIPNPIDLQGLRKSGQTHKVQVTGNNYQVVAKAGGQSTEVLFSNYLAVHEDELVNLRDLIAEDFYEGADPERKDKLYVQSILQRCEAEPRFLQLLLNALQSAYKEPERRSAR